MVAVGAANASNRLLQGRGQPGTHDVELGTAILNAFQKLNASPDCTLELPVYDKSAWEGQGDRAANTQKVHGPVDIVIFEGWCLGFHSLPESDLQERITNAKKDPAPAFVDHTLEHLNAVSQRLKVWEREWYPLFDAFIQFCPQADGGASPWSLVYPWRLQAEHAMKKANGGQGMTDEQVAVFVQRYVLLPDLARYLPSYELFCNDLRETNPWKGRCLLVEVGADREARNIQRV